MPILHGIWGFDGEGRASFADAHAPFAGTIRGGDASGGGPAPSNYAVNLPLNAASSAFGGLGFAFASTNLNIDVRIQAMEQQGRGKTISSPKILTKDNTEAIIKQGAEIPVTTQSVVGGVVSFTTEYKDAVLELKVTPHISSSKNIRINVNISKNEPTSPT